jgi:MerR family transcriptional regulator, light-induced transcriptional regulator
MVKYSINDIEKLSGVKAHTIRIWEKRYDFLPNRRSESNIRFYLDEDLEQILNIAHLNRAGLKISKIASMTKEEIKVLVANKCNLNKDFESHLDALMLSVFELNEYKFLKIVNHQIDIKGFETTMDDVIYPLLDRLAEMWEAGCVKGVHENFINNIIRRKLSVEIDKLAYNHEGCKKFLLYLPEYEAHEMSLLYIYFILKKYGVNTLYLGTQVSLNDVKDAIEVFKPQFIFTLFNDSFGKSPLLPYIEKLSSLAPHSTIIISGYQCINQQVVWPNCVKILRKLDDIKTFCCDGQAKQI